MPCDCCSTDPCTCEDPRVVALRARVAELEQVIRVISPMNKELLGSNQDMSARIARLEYLIACNVDPMNCTEEDAELCRECHETAFPENYRI